MSILTHILAAMGGGFVGMIVFIVFTVEALVGIIFWSLFSVANDADKQQEPVYEDGKRHSGLLEEE